MIVTTWYTFKADNNILLVQYDVWFYGQVRGTRQYIINRFNKLLIWRYRAAGDDTNVLE